MKDARGFTLLELLISVMLLAVLVAITGIAMRLGYRSIDSGEKKIEASERFRTSLSIIGSQIQSQIPLTCGDGIDRKFYFDGEQRALRFATNTSIWGDLKGPVIVSYRLDQDDKGKQVLSATEIVPGIEGERKTVLFDSLDDLFFEYYTQSPLDEEGKWTEDWKDGNTIPEKVCLHLFQGSREQVYILPIRVMATLSKGTPVYAVQIIQ